VIDALTLAHLAAALTGADETHDRLVAHLRSLSPDDLHRVQHRLDDVHNTVNYVLEELVP
jgi:tetrahydromethanopterin S-methyltransferase subunit G